MTDEPGAGAGPTVPPEDQAPEPSTEVVVLDRREQVPARRRWPDAIVRARTRLVALREHPAAALTVSAAATVGSALLTAGLRRALGGSALPALGRTSSVTVRGYVLHEVHVVHHVVHHISGPPAP
jgi:hypothetical protein